MGLSDTIKPDPSFFASLAEALGIDVETVESIAAGLDSKQDVGPYLVPDDLTDIEATLGGLVSDVAYNESTWNGDTTHAPSKNSVRDKIEALADSFVATVAVEAPTGNAVTDTANINSAYTNARAAAVSLGRSVLSFAPGTYVVTPDLVTGVCIPLTGGGVKFQSHNTIIKVADNVGNFVSIFGAIDPSTDASNSEWDGFVFDWNHAANIPLLESEFTVVKSSQTCGRRAIIVRYGAGLKVRHCTFINCPRGAIWFGDSAVPGSVSRISVCDNSFVANVTGTGDWDLTPILVLGDHINILRNTFTGVATNYYLARTPIQAAGCNIVVGFNIIDAWFRLAAIGNPSYHGVADNILCVGNIIKNGNGGIQIISSSGGDPFGDYGIRNIKVCDNLISLNKTVYQRDSSYVSSPNGIWWNLGDGASDLAIENLLIDGNEIYSDPGWTTDGGSLIDLGSASTTPSRNIVIANNTLDNSPAAAISISLAAAIGVTIRNNTIRNPGMRTGLTSGNYSGIKLVTAATFLTILDNDIIDDRVTHIVVQGVYLSTTALSLARVRSGRVYTADGVTITRITLQNNNAAANTVVMDDPRSGRVLANFSKTDDVLTDVPGAKLTLKAGQTYKIRVILQVDGVAASDIKLGFTFSGSGHSGFWNALGPSTASASSSNTQVNSRSVAWNVTSTFGLTTIGTLTGIVIEGIIRTAGTSTGGGDLQLQMCQATADGANPSTIYADSIMNGLVLDPAA